MNPIYSRTNGTHGFKESKGCTFYSYTSTHSVPLPLITKLPIQSQSNEMPNEKLKERIINLKKELNRKNCELHELKLSNNKLEMEKESNLKILDNVIIESKTTDKPIELNRSRSVKEMTISISSYNKLKEANNISNLKRQIALYQRMIREKENEMKSLENESKVVRLIEKNNLLLSTINDITSLTEACEEYEHIITEKEKQFKEDSSTREYYKALNLNLKSDNEILQEQYDKLHEEQNKHLSTVAQYEERSNSLKFQYNTIKQQEIARDKEIKNYNTKIDTIPELRNEINENKKIMDSNSKLIKNLQDDNERQSNIINELEEEKQSTMDQIETKEKERKKKRLAENNTIEKTKKEIILIENNISSVKDDNEKIKNEIAKVDAQINKKIKGFNDYVKEKMDEYNIEDESFEYVTEKKIKKKQESNLVIQSMPDLITVQGSSSKEQEQNKTEDNMKQNENIDSNIQNNKEEPKENEQQKLNDQQKEENNENFNKNE